MWFEYCEYFTLGVCGLCVDVWVIEKEKGVCLFLLYRIVIASQLKRNLPVCLAKQEREGEGREEQQTKYYPLLLCLGKCKKNEQ